MKKSVLATALAVSAMGVALLAGCNSSETSGSSSSSGSGGLFSSGCSGDYGEQFTCYAKKYLDDKTARSEAQTRCRAKQPTTVDSGIKKEEASAECYAIEMLNYRKSGPIADNANAETVDWLSKPEPYPNKDRAYFSSATKKMVHDEIAWCQAQAWKSGNFFLRQNTVSKSCRFAFTSG